MPSLRSSLPWIALVGAAVGYLGLLQHQSGDRADVVILWADVPDAEPARHPESGRWSWTGPLQYGWEVDRIRDERGRLPTWDLDAGASGGLRTRVVEHDDLKIVLIELPADLVETLPALPEAVDPWVDLIAVATNAPPDAALAALADADAPVVVLPGAFGPGGSGDAEILADLAPGEATVAPWVDGRWRVGRLELSLDPLQLAASAVQLPSLVADAGAPTEFGRGGEDLSLNTIRLEQAGLGGALAQAMLDATGAEVALLNHLSIREDLIGPIDMARLEAALPFHNQVVLMTLSGKEIAGLLADNALQDTRYLIAGGLTEGEDGIWRDAAGAPLDGARDYRVATVDYLANGGRGKRPAFLEGRDVVRTGLFTDRLAIDLVTR